jgi:hypothetical protein
MSGFEVSRWIRERAKPPINSQDVEAIKDWVPPFKEELE